MGKFDRVDHLMEQAAAPTVKAEAPPKEAPVEEPSALRERPAPGIPGQIGRQLLGNLDPLMPVLGRALQAVPHGGLQAVGRGVQAAERFLPIFRMFAGRAATPPVSQPTTAPNAPVPDQKGEIEALRNRVEAQEDQLRRTRESLERTAAEQGALVLQVEQLKGRSRLLTMGLVVLFLLAVVQSVLLAMALRR